MIGEINFFKKVCIPLASIHKSFTERAILTSKTKNIPNLGNYSFLTQNPAGHDWLIDLL